MRTRTRRRAAAGILAAVAATLVTACAPGGSNPYSSPSSAAPGGSPGSTVVPSVAPVADLAMQEPANAATIQVCADLGPDSVATGGADHVAAVLTALADGLETSQLGTVGGGRGLYLEVRTTASEAEGGGLVLEAQVPDLLTVDPGAAVTPAERNAALVAQAEQRNRAPQVAAAAGTLTTSLRTAAPAATLTSELLQCISRSNAQMAGRSEARRLLVVVSPLPIGTTVTSVQGDLAATHQIFVLTWGADAAQHEAAWVGTWQSLGAGANVTTYDVADGTGDVLDQAIRGVLA